jgi:sugar phosphate isomerase/epimerase
MAIPPHPSGRSPVGLCVFGFPYVCGLVWGGAEHANPNPLTGRQLIDLAVDSGLSYVEMPVRMLGGTDPSELSTIRAYAEARDIAFVYPSGTVNAERLAADLEIAHRLGARVMRCTLSSVLCGDRRGFPGGWKAHLDHCARELEAVLPQAERLEIAIAIENHQDADSEDLLRLCRRFESRYLGVTLDCGNPLAVMEEPLAFARRIAPYLRHAHLKDYRVYRAPNGCRLVRCAVGAGVVPFPELIALFDEQEFPITRNIELGALQARQIPFLEPTWWDELSPRTVGEILPALSVLWNNCRPQEEEWRTPYERGLVGEPLAEYEWAEFRASLQWLEERGYVPQKALLCKP